MSQISGMHEPTPEFRSHLEWEIVRSMRQGTDRTWGYSGARWQRLRAAAIILIAITAGAVGSVLSAQVRDGRQKGSLLAAAQSDLQLANLRVELARTQYDEARRKATVGVIKREDLAAAAADLQTVESNVARIRLNVEEIRETARPPRDDLSAPLVGGRDFVKARLELELATAQKQLTAAETIAAESGRGFDAGTVPKLVLLDAQAQLARSKAEIGMLAGKLDLRAQFLQHKLKPAEVARRAQRLELIQNLDVAQHLHELAEARLIKIRQMWNVGTVEKVDVLRAELEASEQNADIQRIQRNLELLDRAHP